jgi:hypothetical protein
MIGTNGFLTIRNNEATLFSPRDTFNSEGDFTCPPALEQNQFNFEDEITSSLGKSLEYFLTCVAENRPVPTNQFKSSIETNRFIIRLKTSKL